MNNLAGVIHKSDFPYVSIISEDTIEVRIQTPKSKIKSVVVGYNDPYDYNKFDWIEFTKEMNLVQTDDFYDWWIAQITVDARRFQYNFKLTTTDDQLLYFTEAGLDTDFEIKYQFNLPFSHTSEIFTYPSWVDEAIWYQIYPDRFATTNHEHLSKWHYGDVKNHEIYGGNFQGVISKLDYLQRLGINAIYFTPIFKADTSHKYDTVDYFQIDPQFGTEADFQELITIAHACGIKIMLDGVFNHTSKKHPHFIDVMNNRESSVYKDWYHIRDYDKLDEIGTKHFKEIMAYDSFAYVDNMPKLNTQNPEVIDYIFQAVTKWTKMGIDGWRLDVANEVDHKFWKLFKEHVTQLNPDIYIVGEIWHDSMTWLRGDEFHAVMNYKYTNSIIDYFFRKHIRIDQFKNRIVRASMENITAVNKAAFNIVDSHDTVRVANLCEFDINRQKLGTVFLLTQNGTPCIYYGTEIGLTGNQDPDNRRLMKWDENEWNQDLFGFYQNIIKARKEHPVLGNAGEFKFDQSADYCRYYKYNDQSTYEITLNTSSNAITVNPNEVILSEGLTDNVLGPNGYLINKIK